MVLGPGGHAPQDRRPRIIAAGTRLPGTAARRVHPRLGRRRVRSDGGGGVTAAGRCGTKRRLLIRRIASVVVLTVTITGLAWAGLSAGVLAGFQQRATDSLFPAA